MVHLQLLHRLIMPGVHLVLKRRREVDLALLDLLASDGQERPGKTHGLEEFDSLDKHVC